jgi:hypothetical protein
MKTIQSEFKITFDDSDITNSQQKPIYHEFKNKLMTFPIQLSGYDYYQSEIPRDAKEELIVNGKFSVHNYGRLW